MEETEIIEKIDGFLEKKGYDEQSKYFILKKMTEEYWEMIRDADEAEEEPESDDFEFNDEDTSEDTDEDQNDEELPDVPPPIDKKVKTKKVKIK